MAITGELLASVEVVIRVTFSIMMGSLVDQFHSVVVYYIRTQGFVYRFK